MEIITEEEDSATVLTAQDAASAVAKSVSIESSLILVMDHFIQS